MIGERMGEMIWHGIVEHMRGIAADYWLIAASLVLFVAGLWVGGWQ